MAGDYQNDFWPDDFSAELSVSKACARRDKGIQRASDHAERWRADWNDAAAVMLHRYLTTLHGRSFLTEEFIAWARAKTDMPMPPDGRAWGGVIRRAATEHHIEKVGSAQANTSNRSLKFLWRESEVRP